MDKDFLRLDEIANISCHVKDEMCLIFIQCYEIYTRKNAAKYIRLHFFLY